MQCGKITVSSGFSMMIGEGGGAKKKNLLNLVTNIDIKKRISISEKSVISWFDHEREL